MKTDYEDCIKGYSILDKNDLDAIHGSTLDIMGSFGIRVFGDEPQKVFGDAGCDVDKTTNMVRFPKNLVEDCIASAPAEFTMYARDPERSVHVGGKKVTYVNFSTGVEVRDLYTGEKRESTLEDVGNIVRFMDAIDEIDTLILPVAATDMPQEMKDIYEAEALFNNTSKHFEQDMDGKKNSKYFIRMAEAVAGGREALKERPIVAMGGCPNSPLELHQDIAEEIITAAEAGIPMNVLSMGLCGGTTPVTLAGSLLTTNCEVLTGIILGQLVRKGTPMSYGSSTSILDMKLATSPVGAPEHAMAGAAVAQIGRYYGIPSYVGGT